MYALLTIASQSEISYWGRQIPTVTITKQQMALREFLHSEVIA